MNEKTYLLATNRPKLSMLLTILRNLSPGKDVNKQERDMVITMVQEWYENNYAEDIIING